MRLHPIRHSPVRRWRARGTSPLQMQRRARRWPRQLKSKPLPNFAAGDRVFHKAFGDGLIVSVKPMGGDALLEIAFDQKGTKRLMAKSAGQFMHKI